MSFLVLFFFFQNADRDGPWLGMQNLRTSSVSSKTDKPMSKDYSAASSSVPESRCASMETAWSDSYDQAPKSKGKSAKLKKNSKSDNSKKLIRQGSKDSVVLVGYKNLKAPYGEPTTKQLEEEPPLNPHKEPDTSSFLRTNSNSTYDCDAKASHSENSALDSVLDGIAKTSHYQQGLLTATNLDTQNIPQAGTGEIPICNQTSHKDEHTHQSDQKLSLWPDGLKQIEVKPSNKDSYQGDKVTVLLTGKTDGILSKHTPGIIRTDYQQLVMDSVFERPSKETTQCFPSCVVSVKTESIRLPDIAVPSASSRLSDSGIESEPSSFATQPLLGQQTAAGLGAAEVCISAPQPEKPFSGTTLRPVHQSAVQKPTGEVLNLENTSVVSGVQSSLTSINSLPSDDEVEGSSGGSSGSEVRARKPSVLVQEQSVVFSGDITAAACFQDTSVAHSQSIVPDSDTDAAQEQGGVAISETVKEPCSEPHTTCPSSNSATSSTDLVKRGMVENYFGSRSSTDVSEISPVETSAVTLGIQEESQTEKEDDESEHEMIENGYYEEGDGYAFANGVTNEEQTAVGEAAAQDTRLLFEQLGISYLQETKDLSKAAICSSLTSSSVAYNWGRPPCPSTSFPFSLRWYECAPTPQMRT